MHSLPSSSVKCLSSMDHSKGGCRTRLLKVSSEMEKDSIVATYCLLSPMTGLAKVGPTSQC